MTTVHSAMAAVMAVTHFVIGPEMVKNEALVKYPTIEKSYLFRETSQENFFKTIGPS